MRAGFAIKKPSKNINQETGNLAMPAVIIPSRLMDVHIKFDQTTHLVPAALPARYPETGMPFFPLGLRPLNRRCAG
ncbi:hypothetical protein [Hydrogenophaga electricum]|uniref:hypothetical protein n=1 Tax=Hydrogenophaga electricum TaxID=1230953 RepID=UPI0024E0C0F4|nr:hypothetical protein [Hydrogenophaga electricum]